ncbi:MAG: hypothetical protein JNK82_35420 [Myxococcaceae bacterium]|nr:hypothetical protein [Myxococcaceae bacterium]
MQEERGDPAELHEAPLGHERVAAHRAAALVEQAHEEAVELGLLGANDVFGGRLDVGAVEVEAQAARLGGQLEVRVLRVIRLKVDEGGAVELLVGDEPGEDERDEAEQGDGDADDRQSNAARACCDGEEEEDA